MSNPAAARTAATMLSVALFSSGVLAQARTITDTAPLPASERESVGAVIIQQEPVLAQREAMRQAQERSAAETRFMGAGPARGGSKEGAAKKREAGTGRKETPR